jgi:putative transposase
VLRVCSRSLVPWVARDLIVPGMKYPPGSGIGTSAASGGVQRGIVLAADNALAHHAKLVVTNLARFFRGIVNLGHSHVPETRGVLEAMFRQLEIGAIRLLPGGFEPRRNEDTPKHATNSAATELHPIHHAAITDCLDVVIAGKNATQLAALQERSPLEVIRHVHQSGGWFFESSLSESDARALTQVHAPVTIRGNKRKRRQPFVRLHGARYRSPALRGRYDLIGEQFTADFSFEDVRFLTLYTQDGKVFARLRALPPWSRTRHDLDLRKLILRCAARKLFSIVGADDAVAAYGTFVRANAATVPMVTDWAAKHAPAWHRMPGREPAASSLSVITPRDGNFTFDNLKDPLK